MTTKQSNKSLSKQSSKPVDKSNIKIEEQEETLFVPIEDDKKESSPVLRGTILAYKRDLESLPSTDDLKFNYAVDRNIDILDTFAKRYDVDKRIPKTENFIAFEKDREAINKKFATNDKGEVKTKAVPDGNGGVQIVYELDPLNEEYKKAIEELRVKYESVIEFRDKQIKKYNEFLSEPFDEEITFYKIPLLHCPPERNILRKIRFMINHVNVEDFEKLLLNEEN